jgi:Ran GTPase-activating protein (RanGAP) involved in mRNA processing and transport
VDHNSTFGLNISDLRKIYISKCQDLSIPFFPDQEKRLFNFCWLHFKDRKFCMSDSGIGTITAKTIGDILKNNPNFAYVDLSKNTIKDTGAIDLVKKIRKSFFVVHLNLSSNDITPEGSKTILSLLHKNESLVSLNLSSHEGLHRNRLCVEGAEVIGKTLAHNTVLSYLDVSGTSLGPDGLCYLLKGLENNLTLYSLGISNNNLGSKVVERLCAVLATTDLRDLYLANNKIFDEGCEYLGTLLSGANKGPCTLAKLDLSSNEITTKGLCILLEAVRINTLLNTLVFQKNYLVKGLSDALLPFLSDNTAVQVLDFSNCKLKCEGLSGIGEGLSKNKTLTNLNLSENLIKDRGVENLSHGLLKNKSIITLDLSRNQIKNKGAVSLSKVLKCNNTLQALLLRDNSIKDLGGEALCESLRYNLNINCLSLDVNPMSYKFINDVKELLKHKKNLKSKLLVPKLQEIIEKTSKDTGKSKDIQTIYSIINQKVKDQLEAENKYKIQHEKLKALRETEREKLEEIKNEYKTIKAKSFALNTEIESLHLQLNVLFN